MRTGLKHKLLNLLYPIMTVGGMTAVWAIAAAAVGDGLILPSPRAAVAAFFGLLGKGSFWASYAMTFVRSGIAYVAAGLAAFMLAWVSRSDAVRRALYPLMSVLRAIPTMAVIFMFLLWIKARWSPVYIAGTVLLPTMYAGFVEAFDAMGTELGEMSRVYNVPAGRRFTKMYVPLMTPPLIQSLAYLSLSLKLVIAAEALAMTATSLGAILYNANLNFETARLLAVSLAAVLTGFLIDGLTFTIRRAVKWI